MLLAEDDGKLEAAIGHTEAALDEYRRLAETNPRYEVDIARNEQNLNVYRRLVAEQDEPVRARAAAGPTDQDLAT